MENELKELEDNCLKLESELKNKEKNQTNESLNEIANQLNKIESEIAQKAKYIPPYELRKLQNLIDSLHKTREKIAGDIRPKKKFGFKNKLQQKKAENPSDEETSKKNSQLEQKSAEVKFTIRNKTDETLDISGEVEKNLVIGDLRNCKLRIHGVPSTVHLTNLTDCEILAGPIETSIFVENAENCVFVAACRQARIHMTKDTEFHLHITSRPIIEDCKNVRFSGGYNLTYENLESDFDTSKIDRSVNNFDKVDDFNWLSSDQPSPNWSLTKNEKSYSF